MLIIISLLNLGEMKCQFSLRNFAKKFSFKFVS